MAANTSPIFGLSVKNSWSGAITTADTSLTAPSTGGAQVMVAGTEGAFVKRLLVKPLGTNVATVLRLFLNNGSAIGTSANTALIKEITLPATTISQLAAGIDYEIPLNLQIQSGYKLYAAIGTAIAAGVIVTAEYADY